MRYFERFVSRRYLFSRRQRALVSVITFIAVAGVTVGVAALIIVLGVIEGMDRDIFGKIVEIYPHLKVSAKEGESGAATEALAAKLRARGEVALAVPVIQKQVLFVKTSGDDPPKVPGQVVGIDELGDGQPYPIRGAGGANIKLNFKELLLGSPLGYALGARRPDETYQVLIRTGVLARTPSGWMPRSRNVTAIGHFHTGVFEFDQATGFVSVETARELFGSADGYDYIHVKLNDAFAVRGIKKSLAAELGPGYEIRTWEEENGDFFQALKLEKLGLFVILLLVVIVASFNIVGTLILTVIEKRREIGILKAIGCSDGMIRGTFMTAGTTIGLFGTTLGVGFGLLGCYLLKNVVRFNIASTVYSIDRLPVEVKPLNIALIVVCALTISLLAALFPAAQAGRLDPIEALRDAQ